MRRLHRTLLCERKMGSAGREAVMAWKVDEGLWKGVQSQAWAWR